MILIKRFIHVLKTLRTMHRRRKARREMHRRIEKHQRDGFIAAIESNERRTP